MSGRSSSWGSRSPKACTNRRSLALLATAPWLMSELIGRYTCIVGSERRGEFSAERRRLTLSSRVSATPRLLRMELPSRAAKTDTSSTRATQTRLARMRPQKRPLPAFRFLLSNGVDTLACGASTPSRATIAPRYPSRLQHEAIAARQVSDRRLPSSPSPRGIASTFHLESNSQTSKESGALQARNGRHSQTCLVLPTISTAAGRSVHSFL